MIMRAEPQNGNPLQGFGDARHFILARGIVPRRGMADCILKMQVVHK
jgi:hypothetical protein